MKNVISTYDFIVGRQQVVGNVLTLNKKKKKNKKLERNKCMNKKEEEEEIFLKVNLRSLC